MTNETTSLLPLEKSAPDAAIGTVLVYADGKTGKSTLAHEMYPDALFIDTEGSAKAIEAYKTRINSWDDFLRLGGELKALPPDHPFRKAAIIDTADALARMCSDYAIRRLAGGAAANTGRNRERQFVHASDFDMGKGYSAISEEWALRMAGMMRLIENLVIVAHVDHATIKEGGTERTVSRPNVKPAGIRDWLVDTVDFILYGAIRVNAEGEEVHVLHTQAGLNHIAGGRAPRGRALPKLILMDGPVVREQLEALHRPEVRPEGDASVLPPKPAKAAKGTPKPKRAAQEPQDAPGTGESQPEGNGRPEHPSQIGPGGHELGTLA
jgi:hypothetical protein